MTVERCPICDRELKDIVTCDDCTYEYDLTEPELALELDFSAIDERTYEPDFFDGVDKEQDYE